MLKRLRVLGLESMDAVLVSTGTKISVSILICLHLQEIGVKRIVAKAVDSDHEKILKRVGATQVIHPERDMAERVSRNLSQPNVLDFIPLAAEFELVQIDATEAVRGTRSERTQPSSRAQVHIIGIRETGPERFNLVPPANTVICGWPSIDCNRQVERYSKTSRTRMRLSIARHALAGRELGHLHVTAGQMRTVKWSLP